MNILVVSCHPHEDSLVAAARDAVLAGLDQPRHKVRHRHLYADGFDPRLPLAEWAAHRQPGVPPALDEYATELRWCEHLVLVYPTWWSGPPAMLKGWIDRVWARGVAWELPDGATRIKGRLNNVRRITVVTTHGSSKLVNAVQGESGKHLVRRTLRALCHPLCRTRWIALYGLDTASDDDRRKFLAEVKRKLR